MDAIVKSYCESFITNQGLPINIKDSIKFEHFSAFSVLSKNINNNLLKSDLENISTGDSKGVDTIAFCINEKLIVNADEIDNFERQSMSIEVFFIQSKTSECFNDSELGNFMDVVIDFFSETPLYSFPELNGFREIYHKLLTVIDQIRVLNLNCLYVSLGAKQTAVTTMQATKEMKINQLESLGLWSNINIDFIDKAALLSLYKKAINPIKASIKFDNKIQLTGIEGVDEAYIGFIPFLEFKKLITDEDGNRLKSLFNDNLRDFLGLDNPVNAGIQSTLTSKKFNEFSLLNNGVTVIAEANLGKGNTMVLENYQIVNGCQTSNVLYECKNIDGIDAVLIPLKIVVTNNDVLRDEIILTTNSQSKFTEDQLFAITEFQKTLEDYYASLRSVDGMYYERRTNQYRSLGISMSNIVEIREQLKVFMAMFYEVPHAVAGNIGKIVKKEQNKFFKKEHSPLPYYIGGIITKLWDKLLSENESYKLYNKFRYHIFMCVRYLIEDLPFSEQYLNSPKRYSVKVGDVKNNSYDKILQTLRDKDVAKPIFDKAIELLCKCDYTRLRAVYSGPITADYKTYIINFLNENNE